MSRFHVAAHRRAAYLLQPCARAELPDSGLPAAPDGYGAVSARSHHPGGVYVVMGDGATRFVNDSIDLAVWRGLATIDAGETLPDF